MVYENKLKKALNCGETVFGPFVKLDNPATIEIFGHAGFDFVIIDMEHGPMSMESVENLVRAAQFSGITPIIRVQDGNPATILRALDVGALGVQVPGVSTKQYTESIVQAAKFAPLGERGVCRFVRAANYSAMDKFSYFKTSNKETLVIIHIEGVDGVNNIDEILSTPGIDVIFLGPYDLSQSLGVIGETENPLLIKKFEEVIAKAKKKGIAVGTFVDTVEQGRIWKHIGVQYIAYSVDVGMIYEFSKRVVSELRDE